MKRNSEQVKATGDADGEDASAMDTKVAVPLGKGMRPTLALNGLDLGAIVTAGPTNEMLKLIFGVKTDPAALGLFLTTLTGLGLAGAPFRDFAFAMGAEMEPGNAFEAMLVAQIAVTHSAMMAASQQAWDAPSIEAREAYDRIVNRLARTCLAQMEQFRRQRQGNAQIVRVEHVTVNEGGQAIVGNITGKPGVS
ncbi:MAG: hypothetical protein V4747_20305 [Pseudomonadota bacterium]